MTFQILWTIYKRVLHCFFFCFAGTHVPNIRWHCHAFCAFSLFLTDIKRRRVLACLAISCYREKWIKGCVLNFVGKPTNWDCGIWRRYFEKKNVNKWEKLFTDGRDVNHDARPCKIQHVNNRWKRWRSEKTVIENSRITIREVAEDAGL